MRRPAPRSARDTAARLSRPSETRLSELSSVLATEFPNVAVEPHQGSAPLLVSLSRWRWSTYDPQELDAELAHVGVRGALRLAVRLDVERGDSERQDVDDSAATVLQILTRAQPYLDRRNASSEGGQFDRLLAVHASMHDLSRPLVRADYAHALDTWQWTLRLEPRASRALQIAALFHDIERLLSEADVRIEQHARDYAAFKRSHAHVGAAITREVLAHTGLHETTLERAVTLVDTHELPHSDRERTILNDADALSFFSLNSAGFLDYYGVEHTRRKIAYTLARASAAARAKLPRLRLRRDVAALVTEATTHDLRLAGGRR